MNKKPYQKSGAHKRHSGIASKASKSWNGYGETRPIMKKETLKKTRYKIPKASKKSEAQQVPSKDTSWGKVAEWYDRHLEKGIDTYHDKVVHPNLMRLMGSVSGKKVLDVACGQGIFSRMLADGGASVIGIDLGKELVEVAEKRNKDHKFQIHYFHSACDDLYMVKEGTQDFAVCVLALQNIENLSGTLSEVSRTLKKDGSFFIVLNHPAFRNPTHTHWAYDEHEKVQYRRIDEYMSESKTKIDMTPGSAKDKKYTVTFHRPLQVYSKALSKHGFTISRLEEWISHRESQKGPRKEAEDRSRKEIPLFLAIEALKLR